VIHQVLADAGTVCDGVDAQAKALLAQSPTCPKAVKLDYSQSPTGDRIAASIKDAFARAGINVTPNPIARKSFYSTVGKTAVENELVYAAWGDDWPSGSTVIPPLFDSRQIAPVGNQAFAQLRDPSIDAGMDAAAKITDFDAAQAAWGDLDLKIQQTAAIIPLRAEKALYLRGSKVTGAQLNAPYSDISLLNVGVSK